MQTNAKVGASEEESVVGCREPGCFDGDARQLLRAFKLGDAV